MFLGPGGREGPRDAEFCSDRLALAESEHPRGFFAGTPDSLIEALRLQRAEMPMRADLRQFRRNQDMI